MTTKKATKAGARRVTANLDNLASLFETHHESLGIPQKVAKDFALRCDMLSDAIDKTAGFFNPAQIGEEVSGPEVSDPNNPFMAGHFTQEKFVALGDKQEGGELAANAAKHVADPKLAALASKAAYDAAAAVYAKAAGELPPALKKFNEEKAEKADKKEDKEEKSAGELPPALKKFNEEKAEKADKKEDKEEKKAAEEDDDSDEDESVEAASKKAAAHFGLFSDK